MNVLRKTRPPAVLLAASLAVALGLGDAGAGEAPRKDPSRKASKRPLSRPQRAFRLLDHECNHFGAASCPSTTAAGALTSADCLLDDGSLIDLFQFTGVAGQTVTIDLSSNAFDAYLFLLDQTPVVVAQNDDAAPGNTDSRITFTLTSTGTWTVAAGSLDSSQTGPYTLTIGCADAPTPGPTGPCVVDSRTLCLNGGRFRVRMAWAAPTGESGEATAVPETSDTGTFWFFTSNNVEAIVKVVNGCSFNQRYWVFAAGLTNVAVTTTVTDTQTGIARVYTNAQGSAFAPIQDTNAFPVCP